MPIRVHSISLPVEDLEASISFYRFGLDMICDRQEDHAVVAIGEEVVLLLIPRDTFGAFAEYSGQQVAGRESTSAIFSYYASSPEEVEDILDRAADFSQDGEPAAHRAWGYSGYLTDPDGHVSEIMYVPEE